MHKFAVTLWGSLYDMSPYASLPLSWPEVVGMFSGPPREYAEKDAAPGFGAYLLKAPPSTCYKHQRIGPLDEPHRCDVCVEHLSMGVFDVDMGTREHVQGMLDALHAENVPHLLYSTYSFHPETKPSYRLVIPFSHPVPPPAWKGLRASIIRQFGIPADLAKCSGVSHFYYQPSRPHDAPYFFSHHSKGRLYDTQNVSRFITPGLGGFAFEWEPPEDTGAPADMAALRETLSRKAASLGRSSPDKADLLRRLLKGEPLAEQGARNETTARAAGIVAWALPDTPLSHLLLLFRPSVGSMMAVGSKLTMEKVERMLLSAMHDRAEAEARKEAVREAARRELDEIRSACRRRAGLEP